HGLTKADLDNLNEKQERLINPLMKEINDWEAEQLAAIDSDMPREAERREGTPYDPRPMYGWNPEQAQGGALALLRKMAEEEVAHLKPGDYPTDGKRSEIAEWHRQNDAYKQAVNDRFMQIIQEPDKVREAFGEYPYIQEAVGLPPEGEEQPMQQPVQQPQATGTPPPAEALEPQAQAAGAPIQAQFTPHPKNQWAEQMAQAEQEYDLPPGILQALAQNESSFDPEA